MTDMLRTPRFSLPLLATAQAQKEVTCNEALTLLDAMVHTTVEDGPVATPPSTPGEGQCWIVGASASGSWAGRGDAIAIWTDGGWRFLPPRETMRVWRLADGAWMRFSGGSWHAPASVATPAGGGVVDAQARSALVALLGALAAHGILISG